MNFDGTPDIVVIGASAGGVLALSELVASLPAGLDAAVFVVLHLWPGRESLLPQILSRAGGLPARHPADGTPFETGAFTWRRRIVISSYMTARCACSAAPRRTATGPPSTCCSARDRRVADRRRRRRHRRAEGD